MAEAITRARELPSKDKLEIKAILDCRHRTLTILEDRLEGHPERFLVRCASCGVRSTGRTHIAAVEQWEWNLRELERLYGQEVRD